jgi:hypothetical protein
MFLGCSVEFAMTGTGYSFLTEDVGTLSLTDTGQRLNGQRVVWLKVTTGFSFALNQIPFGLISYPDYNSASGLWLKGLDAGRHGCGGRRVARYLS